MIALVSKPCRIYVDGGWHRTAVGGGGGERNKQQILCAERHDNSLYTCSYSYSPAAHSTYLSFMTADVQPLLLSTLPALYSAQEKIIRGILVCARCISKPCVDGFLDSFRCTHMYIVLPPPPAP
jgi:hypothetical protein